MVMILVDAHVHIYECFDIEKFFDLTYSNFKSTAERIDYEKEFIGVLLLSETSKDNWFHRLTNYADGKGLQGKRKPGDWTFHKTEEDSSLYGKSTGSKELFVIAGKQIVTLEE